MLKGGNMTPKNVIILILIAIIFIQWFVISTQRKDFKITRESVLKSYDDYQELFDDLLSIEESYDNIIDTYGEQLEKQNKIIDIKGEAIEKLEIKNAILERQNKELTKKYTDLVN